MRRTPRLHAALLLGAAVVAIAAPYIGATSAPGTTSVRGADVSLVSATAAAAIRGPKPGPAPAVLAPLTASTPPTTAGLDAALSDVFADPGLGSRVSVAVVDPARGTLLWERSRGGTAMTPASTLKVLTAVAVLDALGPDARLVTKVVRGTSTSGTAQIILVGAGDASLVSGSAPLGVDAGQPVASLADLAARTAAGLRKAGVSSIRLAIDDSLFAGPAVSPKWPASYTVDGVVAPVHALSVDQGRRTPTSRDRFPDPSLAAGLALRDALRDRGITVADSVTKVKAPPRSAVVASVTSPTVAGLVERMLTVSDNDLAEALSRLAGTTSGGRGSFADGAAAVRRTLGALGVPTSGVVTSDGSGLAGANTVPTTVLAATLGQVVGDEPTRQRLWAVLTGLPVAGATGTLTSRFEGASTAVGRGWVRAKTGTLTGVSALSGSVVTADGQLLTYSVIADQTSDLGSAQGALDRLVARLAGCGCR